MSLVIVSDSAGPFHDLIHALCGIPAKRGLHTRVGFDDNQRTALDGARGEMWAIYQALKDYQAESSTAMRAEIEARFEGLRALDRPEIARHNNLAERDIREYVKKRKLST